MTQPTFDPDNYYNGPGADGRAPRERQDATGENATGTGMRAQEVAEQARVYAHKAQAAARNFKPFAERAMRQQPFGTLAAAALIGFVLGALWKR